MTALLCVLFGGLALLQATPGIAAYQLARSEARRVYRVVDEAEARGAADAAEAREKAAPKDASVGNGHVEFRDVGFAYRPAGRKQRAATDDVDADGRSRSSGSVAAKASASLLI